MQDAQRTVSPRIRTAMIVGRSCCIAGAAIGLMGLLGSVFEVNALTTVLPRQPPMQPNTAICLAMIGTIAALRREHWCYKALVLTALVTVLLIAGGSLAEYALDIDLGIDQAFVPVAYGPYPGRPSPLTAFSLVFLSLAIMVYRSRPAAWFRPSELLIVFAGVVAYTALIGMLYNAGPLYRMANAPVIGVALPTGIALLLISIGLMLQYPHAGMTAVIISEGPGGLLFRRLLIPILAGPVLLDLLIDRLLRAPVDPQTALLTACHAVAVSVVGLGLVLVSGAQLNRMHAAIERSHARVRELIDHASDGIFVADLDGRYTKVNTAACEMLGYRSDEIIGKTIVDFIPPSDVPRLWEQKAKLLKGSPEVSEWQLLRKDGSYLPVEVSAKILSDGRWQGFVRDISERKRMLAALQASEAKFSSIISIAADAIISIDEQQRIVIYNKGAEQIFGWTADEALGQLLDFLIPPRFRDSHREKVRRFAAEPVGARRVGQREIFGLRKNGEEFPAEAAVSNIMVGNQRLMSVVLRDISESKVAEREQRLLAKVGAILVSTLEADRMVENVVKALAEEFADCCAGEVLTDGTERRIFAAHQDASKSGLAVRLQGIKVDPERPYLGSQAMKRREPVLIEAVTKEYLASIGQSPEYLSLLCDLKPGSMLAIPLIARDTMLGMLVLVRTEGSRAFNSNDIGVGRELAYRVALAVENARLFARAQRAIAARDNTLGVVAHDLRNPLSVVKSYVALLRRDGSMKIARPLQPLDAIERAASRMDRLIQDLLAVAQFEAGRLTLNQAPVSPQQLVGECVQTQSQLLASSHINVSLQIANELPDVWGDRDRLLQVLENLIGNALKFTPAKGRITVGAEQRDAEVLFWVSDTGKGIPAEALPHIFERFWQVQQERHGAGLGLSIVKGIVEAHGGRIWVSSTPGQGSTFYFTIPVQLQPA